MTDVAIRMAAAATLVWLGMVLVSRPRIGAVKLGALAALGVAPCRDDDLATTHEGEVA
jgi:hypothetical protein